MRIWFKFHLRNALIKSCLSIKMGILTYFFFIDLNLTTIYKWQKLAFDLFNIIRLYTQFTTWSIIAS